MLRLEDRLRVAMGNRLGVTLDAEDVSIVCGMAVALLKIRAGVSGRAANRLAEDALYRLTTKDESFAP